MSRSALTSSRGAGLRRGLIALAASLSALTGPQAFAQSSREIFSPQNEIALVMKVEAALARAQASEGVIPAEAAREITARSDPSFAPLADVEAARRTTGHRMVALLQVWRSRLSENAASHLHFGATTVDIYDTVLTLQLIEAVDSILEDLEALEASLVELAVRHRATPVVGRTLGRHALPLTYGKRVSVWVGELGRHRERLCETRARLSRSSIMKGAVGSYAGLGQRAVEVEDRFGAELGLPAPFEDDWHASRDVYAETALSVSLLSRTLGRYGQDIFLMQMDDIAEAAETRPQGSVGSSSMPHKVNPELSESLIHASRVLPRQAEVILDDVVNVFERDNVSRPNAAMGDLMIGAEAMILDAAALTAALAVDAAAMRRNLDRTGGLISAQAVTQALLARLSQEQAEEAVRRAVARVQTETSFEKALLAEPEIARILSPAEIHRLLDPTRGLETAARQVDRVVAASRARAGQTCPTPN
jgi:adenylosuccinate lyase